MWGGLWAFQGDGSQGLCLCDIGNSDDGDNIVANYELSTWEVFCLAVSLRTGSNRIPLSITGSEFVLRAGHLMGIPNDLAWEFQLRFISDVRRKRTSFLDFESVCQRYQNCDFIIQIKRRDTS